ncbi:sigma factor G inhibitor Gin [Aceticella autotrophica]|uniref:Sigma factor G inhibitor Gin n=2 Tax=Aceticella autotrophica TaxID=2755338 RepID=A0A975AV86_9THEO|nr:sigma factor G inhibitor Gin [Aceticella autotrophica]
MVHNMEIILKRKCFICDQESDEGIEVLGKFLCTDCQRTIVNLTPDNDAYGFYKKKMAEIWEDYKKELEYKEKI